MAAKKSIQFLPEVFRTETNKKFLNATMDQLISDPQLKKITGYIGRKKAPSYKVTDSYIIEPTNDRQNYQLEPSIIIKNPVDDKIEFATTYPDIINQIKYYGGLADRHDRLFDNEYYTYNPQIDLDKFVNFSQYYWLENGPDAVVISATDIPLQFTFDVFYDSVNKVYNFTGQNNIPNPIITLARGGVYNFVSNNLDNPFYIQSKPGVSGFDPASPNINVRPVLGVADNGQDVGTVTFTVPSLTAQAQWTGMHVSGTVDYATNLSYKQVHGQTLDEINELGGLDGFTTSIDGKRIIFVNNDYLDDEFWSDSPAVIADGIAHFEYFDLNVFDAENSGFEQVEVINFAERNDIYYIQLYTDVDGNERVVLKFDTTVDNEQKVRVRAGRSHAGFEYYSRNNLLQEVPLITAPLDILYYQNGNVNEAAGIIRIVDTTGETIDPDVEIIGQKYYTSPAGRIFTNGLKITFDSTVTADYQGKTFFVEGVGSSIRLINVDNLIFPEFDDTSTVDYVTINRSSLDQNGWSRRNRWFHTEVIKKTAEYNNTDALYNQTLRAQRPIIEFAADLQLYQHGTVAKAPIDKLDTVITNAYLEVQGLSVYITGLTTTLTAGSTTVNLTTGTTDGFRAGMLINFTYAGLGSFRVGAKVVTITSESSFTVDLPHLYSGAISFTVTNGNSTTEYATFISGDNSIKIDSGSRVIFSNDENNDVRNKIYNFTIEQTSIAPGTLIYKSYIIESDDTAIDENHVVTVISGDQGKRQWYYDGTTWKKSQLKSSINQFPKFDIVDSNGVSLSNPSSYPGSNFYGTEIFKYKIGTGTNDSVLGFPLSYKNFQAQGDIEFENSYDNDTFEYLTEKSTSGQIKINFGLLQKNITRTTSTRQNIWIIAEDLSKQFQSYSFVYDGVTNLFPIDNLPDLSVRSPNIRVTVNNNLINSNNFATTQIVDRYAILVNPDLLTKDDIVFISIYDSKNASPNAFYEIPINLDINSSNTNISTLTLGQIRNHLITIKNKSLDIVGDVPGNSNLRDVQYMNKGGSILQHSASVVYAGLFLSHPTMNFANSIKLAAQEYNKFKIKFLELSANLDLDRTDIAGCVDTIIGYINNLKNSMFPWYYSDMIPYGAMDHNILPTYSVLNPTLRSYEITNIFQDTVINNKAVFVYLTRTIDNITSTILLVKDRDFIFEQERPAITFLDTFTLLYDDKIDIIEYTNTHGSYVPETPTKLGLYPKFVPEIFTDTTYRTPTLVIQGHDGSITPAFNDYRDNLLLELERRIYNNIKVNYDTNIFNLHDYLPGKFRITDYTLQEFNQLLSRGFLNWIGTNRIDFSTNSIFKASDPFTWNYKKFRDVINGESLPGTWRSIYKYFYDTDRPHTHPWEMLGLSEKPAWWEDRYGPAPYTGGNSVLWSDLSLGYIHQGPGAGFNIRFQRPNLSQIIPVDENGELKSPEKILVVDFDSAKANSSYSVGDQGPAETAWRRSSDYPFALSMALALAKPAKYFALLLDVQNYYRDPITAQFVTPLINQHLAPENITVNGYKSSNGITQLSSGYLNWIRDYIKNLGIDDASGYIKNNLDLVSVQLAYKVGGFTDKKFISILAEQSSPSSINDSVIIPDENYRIELYKGSPSNKLIYSGVIVEKSAAGYTVSGYDLSSPYFFIIPSQTSNNSYSIKVGTESGVIYNDYRSVKLTVPYGFEFNTKQQVIDFLISYQRYLIAQGFIFEEFDADLKEKKNWVLSAKEFLYWAQQGWKTGSILVLSPVNDVIQVFDDLSVVDEITNKPNASRVTDVNNKAITKNNFTVQRENNLFTLKSISGQTIAFAELNLVQFEHLLILDNQTVFRDVIYAPELGNRQYRLKLVGSKTANWSGSLELPGFMYSSPTVDLWLPGKDYLKGSIVKHKARYYTSLQNIVASDEFQTNSWKLIPSDELRSGMINNFATNAEQAISYYDVDNPPDNEDLQKFSFGLIGFRERSYFATLGIDLTTQNKFYQGLIKEKGTYNSLIALQGSKFNNIDTNIDVYENWAVRVGEYGALDNNQYVELALDEARINTNPMTLEFVNLLRDAQASSTPYTFKDLYKSSGTWTPNLLKTELPTEIRTINKLPVAGFVHTDDVDATIFNISDYSTLTTIVNSIGSGFKIWTAKDFDGEWNVYRASAIAGITFALRYNIDNLVEVIHNTEHGLATGDLIVLKNFDAKYDGVYRVQGILDSTRFYVEMYQNLQPLIQDQAIIASGILLRLTSLRVSTPNKIDEAKPSRGWVKNDKVWVDNLDSAGGWGVFDKTDPWEYSNRIAASDSQYIGNDHFGQVIDLNDTGKDMYVGAPDSGTGRVTIFRQTGISAASSWQLFAFLWGNSNNLVGFGSALANGSDFLAVGCPASGSNKGYVYLYKNQTLIQLIYDPLATANAKFGQSLAMSDDGRFLYIGAPGENSVYCYALAKERPETAIVVYGDGVENTFTVGVAVTSADQLIVTNPLNSSELIPTIEYTVSQFTNGVDTFTFSGTPPSVIATYRNVSATGGSGSGAKFDVFSNLTGPGLLQGFEIGKIYKIASVGTTDFTLIGASSNTVGVVFTATGPGNLSTSGTAYYINISISNAGTGYLVADTLTIDGALIGGISTTNDQTITIGQIRDGTNIVLTSTPTSTQRVSIITRPNYYKLIHTITKANGSFGYDIKCNSDGSIIAVSANTETIDSKINSGAIYVYHRTIAEFITDGLLGTYIAPDAFNDVREVKLNGNKLIENVDYYIVGTNSIQFNPYNIPLAAQVLLAETNQFVFDQKLTGLIGVNNKFGTKLAICSTGCNLIGASPEYRESSYQFGALTRFINVGRVYGTVTGTISNPTVTVGDTIIINNRLVQFVGSELNDVVRAINDTNIPGITAVSINNRLRINSQVVVPGQKLDIKAGSGTGIDDLGINIYVESQTIKHPYTIGEKFGISVTLNADSSILAVGSEGADIKTLITFDNNRTIFDSDSTTIIQSLKDSGGVYIYDLMNNPNEAANDPSLFVLSQTLSGPNLTSSCNFGSALAVSGQFFAVGVSKDSLVVPEGGSIYGYYNASGSQGWTLLRYKENRVDVDAINAAFIYDSESSLLVNYFDELDPAKGKLLGIVDQELDYKEKFDPASYNLATETGAISNMSFYWSNRHVGKTWWDLSQASFIDYEQGTLEYRAKNWGSLFPGSTVKIYEWVESNFLPSQYVAAGGDGIPKYINDTAYTSVNTVDPSTGVITQKYYYWVGDKTEVNPLTARRTLSIKSLESYITNPREQGVPYIAPLSTNAIAVYNILDSLRDDKIILHLDLAQNKNNNLIHTEFELIQQGNPVQIFPSRIIKKLKDSLAGFDSLGASIPDFTLSPQDRIGLSLRPRQSIFVNRLSAVETFVRTVNNILIKYPILLITQPSLLYSEDPVPSSSNYDDIIETTTELLYIDPTTFGDGYTILIPNNADYNGLWTIYQYNLADNEFQIKAIQSYKTTLYWTALDWYDLTFDPGSQIDYIVQTYGDIQRLSELQDTNLIKVLDNGNGQWLIYQYSTIDGLVLKGAQRATFSIDSSAYDVTQGAGFDVTVFDQTAFDSQIGLELVNIFDSIYTEILTKDLAVEFNNVFFSIVNYIFSEQYAPDWIFKTSFIDVYHQLRTLEQIPNYVRDNQTFYEDYINEIKPYRTKIRDYVPTYNNLDTNYIDIGDFDLPSFYDFSTGTFRSPDVNNVGDAEYFTIAPYKEWYDNYTYKITEIIVSNIGLNYSIAPSIEITGGGGSGAKATANVLAGQITGITVVNPGSGYTTTPTITINGVGVGGMAYPLLKNEFYREDPTQSYNTIRNILTELKFDRIDYSYGNIITWNPVVGDYFAPTTLSIGTGTGNIWVLSGNIYAYNNEAFILNEAYGPLTTVAQLTQFDYTKFTKLNPGNVLLRAAQRISAYYSPDTGMPPKNLPQLMSGVDYPGVQVTAAKFTANDFEIVSDTIQFNYTGQTIYSANVSAVNFVELGFELDQSIKIQAMVPFNFNNNNVFKIITVERDYLRLTGEPIETTYKMLLSSSITVNAGDIITQANTLGNAYVLQSVTNSRLIDIVHVYTGFQQETALNAENEIYNIATEGYGNVIYINGVPTSVTIEEITTGGNAHVKIGYLELDTNVLDSNIYSTYLDTALGTRPEDINITGGEYVDIYSSHAPEELVPGRMYDALEMRIFTNTAANTATYGTRTFVDMNGNIHFNRISANATTMLTANLYQGNTHIFVANASVLPDAQPDQAVPGVIFINGEKIHYYQKYDDTTLATAIPWTANTYFATGSLISNINNGNVYLTLGNVYANSNVYISQGNLQQVFANTLTQLRRGVDGTGSPYVHLIGNLVADTSLVQEIPDTANTKTITGNLTTTANVSWRLTMSSNITVYAGDYITQFVGNTGNARVLADAANTQIIAVEFVTGNLQLAANLGTRVNIAYSNIFTTTFANVSSMRPLGQVYGNGNVILSGVTVTQSNLWVPLSTGVGLEGSTLIAAQFIKAEPSYIP